jgi:hypothetical protein
MIDHKQRGREKIFSLVVDLLRHVSRQKFHRLKIKKLEISIQHNTTQKKAHAEQIHVSAAARWVFARKEALLFALIVLPLLFDLLFSLIVVLE